MIFDAVGVGHCAWLVYFITRNLWLVHIQYLNLSCYLPLHVLRICHLSSHIHDSSCICHFSSYAAAKPLRRMKLIPRRPL